jgi:hypothetical protein
MFRWETYGYEAQEPTEYDKFVKELVRKQAMEETIKAMLHEENLPKNVWLPMSQIPSFVGRPIVFYDDSPHSVFSERWAGCCNPSLEMSYSSNSTCKDYFKRFSQFMILSNPNEKVGE